MQTMPAKSRTAWTVGAVILGLVVVGALALFSGKGKQEQAPLTADDPYMTQELTDASIDSPFAEMPTDTLTETGVVSATPSGIAETTAPVTMSGTDVPATHVVAKGETLRSIAEQYYGDPVYAGDIEALNGLENPNHIKVGDELQLPRAEDVRQ